jgi:hypothetical protein
MKAKNRKNKKYPLKLVDAEGRIKCLHCGKKDFPYYNKPLCRECSQTHSFCLTLQKVLPLSEFYPGHLSESKEATKMRNTALARKKAKTGRKYTSTADLAKKMLMEQVGSKQ